MQITRLDPLSVTQTKRHFRLPVICGVSIKKEFTDILFTKAEIKEFTIKYGKKWFFPDFTNKLTWYVVILGAGIILTPAPLKMMFYNWLIDTFNIDLGTHFTFPELQADSADYIVGFGLILIALIHNLFSKWLLLQGSINDYKSAEKINEVDNKLYTEFLELMPSNSCAMYMLEQHDFGNSFEREILRPIDQFVCEWDSPEKQFLNKELEEQRKIFWSKCNEFITLLAKTTSPISGGFYSAVSDRFRNNFERPDWLEKEIRELNRVASEVFMEQQKFIKFVRQKLKC